MIQKLQLRKDKPSAILLPQKWLLCLLTLLLTFVGSNQAWAQEVVTWTANTDCTAGQELSTNTDIISVKTGTGTWTNTSSLGITNNTRGDNLENSGYIVIEPKVNVQFSLRTYSSQSNCNLIMTEEGNPSIRLKDFRQKADVTNDFGNLIKGHKYYIYGVSFKDALTFDYVYFKSFTATEVTLPASTVTFDSNKGGATETTLAEEASGSGITLPQAYMRHENITSGFGAWEHVADQSGSHTYNGGYSEIYFFRAPTEIGDMLWQQVTGLANGTYEVVLKVGASATNDRDHYDCPTGDNLTVAFAGDQEKYIPVVNRTAVNAGEENTVTFLVTVTDGTLRYGLRNKQASGNWYIAKLESLNLVDTSGFKGWYTAASGGTKAGSAGDTYYPGGDITLHAQWSGVYFNATDGNTLGIKESAGGEKILLPAAYKAYNDVTSGIGAWEHVADNSATHAYGTYSEIFFSRAPGETGDMLWQKVTGLAGGTYEVVLKVAASATEERDHYGCPLGDDQTVVFAGLQEKFIPVVSRTAVNPGEENTVSFIVTVTNNGTLTYGLRNKKASGNWYIAKLESLRRVDVSGFNGWYTAAEGGTKVGGYNAQFTPDGSILYAQWANVPSAHPISTTGTIGNDDCSSGFATVFTPYYNISPNQEREFTFKVKRGSARDAWNSFVLIATPNEETSDYPYQYGINDDLGYLVLRPDNYGWGISYNPDQKNLALKGGALDWNTFKNDLDNSTVNVKVSYNGEMLFIYWTVENNGRKYTYFHPTKLNIYGGGDVKLYFSPDLSQIYDFQAKPVVATRIVDTVVEDVAAGHAAHPDWGTVTITNEDGVNIPAGASLGIGTKIRLTATPADGYIFEYWSNGDQTLIREFSVGSNSDPVVHTFHAYFSNVSKYEASWTMTKDSDPIYVKDPEGNLVPWDKTYNGSLENGAHTPGITVWSGAYNSDGVENPSTVGLLFNSHVAKMKSFNGFQLDAHTGGIKVPVLAGEKITIWAYNAAGGRDLTIDGANGGVEYYTTEKFPNGVYTGNYSPNTSYTVTATQDGYLDLMNYSNNDIYVTKIEKTLIYDFDFEDGYSIAAKPGSTNYINPIVAPDEDHPLLEGAQYVWTSSDPSQVAVDPVTGSITVNENFAGNVQISATRLKYDNYPPLTKTYNVISTTYDLSFDIPEATIELQPNGVGYYWQDVKGLPDGAKAKWYIVEEGTTVKKADVTTGDNNTVTINGTGYTVVMARSGALSATYRIHSTGYVFNDIAAIYRFPSSNTYQQTLEGVDDATYRILEVLGEIKDPTIGISIDPSTGVISGFRPYDENKGGAIVVEAANSDRSKVAVYTLTVPYKKYVWNFYKERNPSTENQQGLGQRHEGDGSDPYHMDMGSLLKGSPNPGAAGSVPMWEKQGDEATDLDGVTYQPRKEEKRAALEGDLRKRKTWMKAQEGELADNDAHKYWDYTFKTMSYESDHKTIWYTNEPLFSYKFAVNGDNARVIKDTQGLVFNCGANKFGMNDNANHGADIYASDGSEQDRAVLLKGYSTFTIPQVTKGHYVRIHWYRHAPDAGDQFTVTNAMDLDGRIIPEDAVLRFTSAHYTHHNWEGSLFLRAAETGDITIRIANEQWTELFRIELTDVYETDQKLCEQIIIENENGNKWGWTAVGFEKDINDVGVFNDEGINGGGNYEGPRRVNKLVSRIQTQAKGGQLIKSPDNFYFTGYAAHCYTWNGWTNTNVQAEFEGSARCDVVEDTENGFSNILPIDWARLGERMDYQMHPLKNVKGEGTIKLTFRTITGYRGEPHYTLNKTEAYVPVGEYSVQEYPYTWDFTKYNMDRENRYEGGFVTLDMLSSEMNVANKYGSFNNDMALQAAEPQDLNGDYAYYGGGQGDAQKAPAWAVRNKRFFAQTSQLSIGDGSNSKHTILETEGLRFSLNGGVCDANDGHIRFVAEKAQNESNAKQRRAWSGHANAWDNTKLNVNNTTITIPEVDEGMYVFVRSAVKPSSVTGAVDYNTEEYQNNINMIHDTFNTNYNDTRYDVYMKQDQMLDNTWVYKVVAGTKKVDANGNIDDVNGKSVADVSIVFNSSTDIEAIGVTNEWKMMTNGNGWATDSRERRIDYSETATFTKSNLQPYVTYGDPEWDAEDENKDCGWIATKEVNVIASMETTGDANRGIILEDKANTADKTIFSGERRLIPLFVPACNIDNDDISGNKIKHNINEKANMPASDNDYLRYVFTNAYFGAVKKGATIPEGAVATVADEYSYYIVRQAGTLRANSSYLEVPNDAETNASIKMRQMFMYIAAETDADEEATAIEEVSVEGNEPTGFYTLSGMKLDGMPTKRGIYIMNGKKVFVK